MVKDKYDPGTGELLTPYLDDHGHEVVSSRVMAPPVGFVKQPSMVDHIRAAVRSEMLRREVIAQGFETFEESDDFGISDDPIDPSTPYEEVFDPAAPDGPEPARAPPEGGAPAAAAPVAAPALGVDAAAAPGAVAAPAAPVKPAG